MILKTQPTQIFDFLTQPGELLFDRAARFHFKSLQGVLEGKADLDYEKEDILRVFPDIAAGLGTDILKHAGLSECLRQNPLAAMRLLLTNYDKLNKVLEPIVLGDAEATYYFLVESKEKGISLAQAEDTYLAVLLSDPFWATRLYADTKDEKILSRILSFANKDPNRNAGTAWAHCYFNTDADISDFEHLFNEHPMYAYLASRHFYARNLELKYMNLRHLNARWAYHFITDGFLDNEEGLIDSMLEQPEWLVEYLVESERYKDVAYINTVIERSLEKISGGVMTIHLQRWLERTVVYAKKLEQEEKAKKAAKAAKKKKE